MPNKNEIKTILDTIDAGTLFLEKRGINEARRCMQLLVGQQLDLTKVQLYLEFDRPIAESDLEPLREKVKQRAEGIPLQHLLGFVEFHKKEFKCDSRALVPRPETEELVEHVLKLALPDQPKILDIGAGTGVIGLSLASQLPNSQVTLCDLSSDALSLAEENAKLLQLENVALIESDLFSKIDDSFDLVVSNPPYIEEKEREHLAKEVQRDPEMALFGGSDGLDIIRRICVESPSHLHQNGWLAMEIGYNQSNAVLELLRQNGFSKPFCHNDLSGIARFPIAQKN